MKERGKYSTTQQRMVLEYLEKHSSRAFSAGEVYEALFASGEKIGQTTVYRALDRLASEDSLIKVPSFEGKQALYRYIGKEENPSSGKMVCLGCGRTIPLECEHLEALVHHIGKEHDFEIDTRHTVLYGYCKECRALNEK